MCFPVSVTILVGWCLFGTDSDHLPGMHKDSDSGDLLSEFDREMRRRLWCIIWNADCTCY